MKPQRGAALMVILLIVGVLAAMFAVRALNGATAERDKVTTVALAQAKDALVGYAATYPENELGHAGEVFGYLPSPDMGSTRNSTGLAEGVSGGSFTGSGTNVSALGRLPWRTLRLPPLRDEQGECLWVAVSGSYQDAHKARFLNWDTLGQFDPFTSDGTPAGTVSSIGVNDHRRVAAVVFAPGAVLNGQIRGPIGADLVSECRGNYDAHNYLDTFNPMPAINNIVNYLSGFNSATGTFPYVSPKPILAGRVVDAGGVTLVNDKMLTISPQEIFTAVRQRSDFGGFVDTQLLDTAASNVGALAASVNHPVSIDFNPSPPVDMAGFVTVGSLEIGRIPTAALTSHALENWQDNLLYARCVSGTNCLSLNVTTSCSGMLIFAGERAVGQSRASPAQKNTWSNYLEGPVLAAFTTGGTAFSGPTAYSAASSSVDVLRCVTSSPAAAQTSFAADFSSFVATGSGVTANVVSKAVAVATAPGSGGGCFWSPALHGLAGKRLRAYFEFAFSFSDTVALTGTGPDRGNGLSMQFVTGQFGVQPNTCGSQADMGVLASADAWGHDSIIFENDVNRDVGHADPVENHSAILLDGFLDHAPAAPSSTISTACNGSAAGCRHTPPNKFEESPLVAHNQRIEVHTGCNATCTVCNPPAHGAPNNYARITGWTDCASCNNVTLDLDRIAKVPTIQRCVALNPVLNNVYFGITGGFRSGGRQQGVTVNNLIVRSE